MKEKNRQMERTHTLYVNVIGKSGEEIIEDIEKAHAWLRNPRKRKTFYGTFRATKRSYLLSKKDFEELKALIAFRCKHVYGNKVLFLVEDYNNVFIIEQIEY